MNSIAWRLLDGYCALLSEASCSFRSAMRSSLALTYSTAAQHAQQPLVAVAVLSPQSLGLGESGAKDAWSD
jgi:hypothetical protein